MKTLLTLPLALLLASPVLAQETSAVLPKLFPTPIEAADAFIAAAKNGEQKAILEVFGDKYKDLIGTNEPERDKQLRSKVAAMAVERRRFRENHDNSVTMVIGAEAWPFPVPIVKTEKGWHFDADTGIGEIIHRRIGENELSAIASLRAYVDAQRAYASEPRDGSNVRQFAQLLQSSPGKKDGLHWIAAEGEAPSPAGPGIKDEKEPHNGYHFRILTSQGSAAPAGKYSYMINGHLIAGFAMVAWPSEYGKSGVMSLLVNHYGEVYEKDLGPETSTLAAAIREYNPDETWTLSGD